MSDWHAWAAVAVFVVAYALIVSERLGRTAIALAGAGAVLVLHATDDQAAFFDERTGIDWNVLFLLFGMMVIVGVLSQTGIFEYLAIWSAKRARGRPFRVLTMMVVLTAVASALLDNVTTVLLVVPVTLLVCERLALAPTPFLLAEVFAANIGGEATLVGDPPNIIIATRAGLSFNDFLVNLLPISALLVVTLVGLCRLLFRSALGYDADRAAGVMTLRERDAIRDPALLVQGLVVLALVIAGFVLHPVLGYAPSVVALLGAGLLVAVSRTEPAVAMKEVEWSTLAFFAGLFVLVGALVETGVIDTIARGVTSGAAANKLGATAIFLGGSAVLSGVVDNIPYVATVAPITEQIVAGLPGGQEGGHVLWWALTLGADLGGNATAVGASANVVVLGLAARAGTPISFWQFTRHGLIVTATTVAIAAVYLYLRYFAFG